jgi:hypothetical protein
MGYGKPQSHVQPANPDRDRGLVQLTLDILRQASASSDNSIALEAVQGLETLTSLATGNSCLESGQNCQNPCARIVVPYAGMITISPGTFFTNQQVLPEQSATARAPIFSLSDGNFLPASIPNQGGLPTDAHQNNFGGFNPSASRNVDNLMMPEYPSIDFDWGSMVNMNTEEDWAWLMDVNSNGPNGSM